MQILRFALRNLWRDLRSGELSVLLLALCVAVLSLTAVGFFTSRISQGVRAQAAEVLAADLRLESPRPIPARYFAQSRTLGLRSAQILSFPTAIFNGDASQLAALQAVSANYPLRGHVRIADTPFGAARITDRIPGFGRGVGRRAHHCAAEDLLGRAPAHRRRLVSGHRGARLPPGPGHRLRQSGARGDDQHRGHRGDAADPAGQPRHLCRAVRRRRSRQWRRFANILAAAKAPGERLREVDESSRQLNSAVDRASRFLNLASLASVLLAAVAVAMGARRYASRHIDTVALMKCMGASQRFVLAISIIELTLLAAASVAAGAALGYLAQWGLAWLLRGSDPHGTAPRLARTAADCAGHRDGDADRLRAARPAAIEEHSAGSRAAQDGDSAAAALRSVVRMRPRGAVCDLVELRARYRARGEPCSPVCSAWAWCSRWRGTDLVRLTGRLRGGVGVAWRYGLANVSRRGGGSVVQIVAFGLGLMVLLLLAVVRGDLLADWRRSLPADVPNNFLVNIRPEERRPAAGFPEVAWLRGAADVPHGACAHNGHQRSGQRVAASPKGDSARGYLEREQNLTWTARLMDDNQLVAGRWWTAADFGKPMVSISSEYQEALKLKLGDTLRFDVAGESLTVRVASIRKVRWDSFRPNFFLVFPPGLLDGAAGTYMTSIYLTAAQRPALVDLVRQFPTVSVFDVDAISRQIRDIMDRASLAVQYVFLFTLAAGVVVLLAAVQSTRDERRYESAMLRTLGASRATVLQGVAAEFSALGFLSGTLAALGASAVGWMVARRLFSLQFTPDPRVWVIGLMCGTILVGVSGTLATRRVVNTPPIVSLRDE